MRHDDNTARGIIPREDRRAFQGYGLNQGFFNAVCLAAVLIGAALTGAGPARAAAPIRILAFGDSLTAGYGLPADQGFTAVLRNALAAQGVAADIVNAGVSGDTTAGGRGRHRLVARREAVGGHPRARRQRHAARHRPQVSEANLDAVLGDIAREKIPVVLAGMVAAPNLGPDYGREFNGIYPRLAAKYDAILYPFFLAGVAGQASLNQDDGIHPNADGVKVIVSRILPSVLEAIRRAGS